MALHRTLIQNKLREIGLAGPFHPVVWKDKTFSVDANKLVNPGSVLANEISALWSEPVRNRRDAKLRERSSWPFELIIEFPTEVSLEAFEEVFSQGIVILGDSAEGTRQVTIELLSAAYSHPAMSDPKSGTRVTYSVNARLAPL